MKKLLIATMVMSTMMSMNAFAAGWQQGSNGWWYATNEDNSQWYSNGWQWIDSNGDGSAECYYFDPQGWLLTNTTAPDGSQVNENGAWVVNGVVQTKAAAVNESENVASTAVTQPRKGAYRYFETSIYKVEADNSLTLVGKTSPKEGVGAQFEERINVIGFAGFIEDDLTCGEFSLTDISETTCTLDVGGDWKLILDNGFWYEDMDQNGVLSAEEKEYRQFVMKNEDTIEVWICSTVDEYETIAGREAIAGSPEFIELTLEAKYGWGLGTPYIFVDTFKLQ